MATVLKSFVCGKWHEGTGKRAALLNPSTEQIVAEASSEGIDFGAVTAHARAAGVKLRAMTFAQRAELLKALAKSVSDAREELIGLGIVNAGTTRSDSKFDIDGASSTLLFYAELGAKLGDVHALVDGEGIPLGRSARLYGQHVLTPREGVAVHINAFNFPAWGMAEKLAVSLLCGVPAISKPATATALMAHRIAQLWADSSVLPDGAFQFICGNVGDLLSHLGGQDVLAFTGSGDTAEKLRRTDALLRTNAHVNVEADSLNSAVLGPDVTTGSETMNLFLADVVKEMTQKTGQKCTAIRRIYVHRERFDEVRDLLVDRLREVRVGNPADDKVTMGPVATAAQLRDVLEGIARLKDGAQIALGGTQRIDGQGAPGGKGFFVAPTLLTRAELRNDDVVNRLEVFGPVATMLAYSEPRSMIAHVAAGGGGLVSSIFSDDKAFVKDAVLGLAPFHGRLTLSSEKVAGQTVPPGTVMPQLLHGGPGRAGGGEELGGTRGMSLYLQRTALQGHRALIEQLFAPKPKAE